jgi:glycosyltransferase involved in cell wall biosynthesis
LFVSAIPAQSELAFPLLADQPGLDFLVVYCTLPDPNLWQGEEQLNRAAFPSGPPTGFPWRVMPNWSPFPALNRAWGLCNPAVLRLISKYDCIVVFGHNYLTFLLSILAALLLGKPLILANDAVSLGDPGTPAWKRSLKRRIFRSLYGRLSKQLLVPSSRGADFFESIGIDARRIQLAPYVVDNDAIRERARGSDRSALRREWKVPQDGVAVVFCGKLIERKGVRDLIRAFAQVSGESHCLILVGEGPLEDALRREARELGVDARVRFLGLVPYERLPGVYAACDLLVHPAHHEPFGLIVNEAMVCGLPVVVSDSVGAGPDLVRSGETGFVYPTGRVDVLSEKLALLLDHPETRARMGAEARRRIESWSPVQYAEALLGAVRAAIDR